MNNNEKFAAELCWGCIPLDSNWIKQQNVFKDMLKRVEAKEFNYLKLKHET